MAYTPSPRVFESWCRRGGNFRTGPAAKRFPHDMTHSASPSARRGGQFESYALGYPLIGQFWCCVCMRAPRVARAVGCNARHMCTLSSGMIGLSSLPTRQIRCGCSVCLCLAIACGVVHRPTGAIRFMGPDSGNAVVAGSSAAAFRSAQECRTSRQQEGGAGPSATRSLLSSLRLLGASHRVPLSQRDEWRCRDKICVCASFTWAVYLVTR